MVGVRKRTVFLFTPHARPSRAKWAEVSMQRLCVFCGSNAGGRTLYTDATRQFGELLAARGLGVVFGGGHVGLMGVLADAVLQYGGNVIGVIPQALVDKELAH